VQGVGFRHFVRRHADAQQLGGYAKNLDDGRVEFLLQGHKVAVESVLEHIHQGPGCSTVNRVEAREYEGTNVENRFLTL